MSTKYLIQGNFIKYLYKSRYYPTVHWFSQEVVVSRDGGVTYIYLYIYIYMSLYTVSSSTVPPKLTNESRLLAAALLDQSEAAAAAIGRLIPHTATPVKNRRKLRF